MWKKLKFKYLKESIGLYCGLVIVALMLRFTLKVEPTIINSIFNILVGSYGISIIIHSVLDIVKILKKEDGYVEETKK
jgi:hypothetical protein